MRLARAFLGRTTALAVLTCSLFVVAKDKDKESADVKFTSRTQLVLIPTLVTNKAGAHISGLTKDDFIVLENGAERKIASFEEVTSDTRYLSHPRNPNEFRNTPAGGESNRRVTLIVLDFINTAFEDQAYAREQLLKYLSQSVDQREPTGLFTLGRSGVHIIHDFTTDPRVLIAALRRVMNIASHMVDTPEDAGIDPAAVQSEAQRLQTMMEDAKFNFQSFQQRVAITYTLQAMQQLAQTLAGFPGRKSLIWASGGFPFGVSDNTMQLAPAGRDTLSDVLPLYQRTWRLLNDAQIALYPVDVRGLLGSTPMSVLQRPRAEYNRNMTWLQLDDTHSTFQIFAAMTGGRAYYNSNDLVSGFREAVRDSSQYYLLGYYLDRSDGRVGWRKLAVKVKRDHVNVRARSGFFVTPATENLESSRVSDIDSAVKSPMDYTALPLVTTWDAVEAGSEPGKKQVIYVVNLAAGSVFVDDTDHNHISLEFLALARTTEDKSVDSPKGQIVDLHPPADRLEVIRQKGISYRGALNLAPGEYSVRFVVRDNLSGRVGSVAAPLKVQ